MTGGAVPHTTCAAPTRHAPPGAAVTLQEETRLHGGLYALRILSRKYEFRDEDDRAPLNTIVNSAFPVLLHIFQQMLASQANSA